MRLRPLLAACAVAVLAAAGCGGDERRSAQRAPKPVELSVDQPSDTAVVRDATIEVQGRVEPPDSEVLVMGRPAAVAAGAFSIEVGLEEGPNVIDVSASAPRRSAALTAFRVTRKVTVAVPDLVGATVEDAEARVEERDLEIEKERGGGIFDGLRPGPPVVCAQDPAAGSEVRPGTTVRVVAAREC